MLLSAWRAISLKSKNVKLITSRFKRFKSRMSMRKHFIAWYDGYLRATLNVVQTPSFKVDYTKYLPTKADRMKKTVR